MTTFLAKHSQNTELAALVQHALANQVYPGISLASPELVNDHEAWIAQVQDNDDPDYLSWCWYSTRENQRALPETFSYNDIKHRALVWLAIIKSGREGWWADLSQSNRNSFEAWALAVADARFGRVAALVEWIELEYAMAKPASMELQVFWELALLALRELLHLDSVKAALWPHFLDTLSHLTHFPENLPLRIIPDMAKDYTEEPPAEFWQWFDHPLFPQARPYEKHIKPGGWSILWHAWLPPQWRHAIAIKIVETVEEAMADGIALKLPDDLRTIWQVGPSFAFPYNILLARAMLTSPRQDSPNPWSHNITEHWLDDIEHFYPDAHFLRTFNSNLDGLTVEDARAWLTQRAYPATSGIELPLVDFVDNDN